MHKISHLSIAMLVTFIIGAFIFGFLVSYFI